MGKGRHENQGVKLMIIRDYLIHNTRKDDHCVSARTIADYLKTQEEIPTDIKTVYNDLNRLREQYHLKIEYSAKHKGWYLANPEFEPNEVRLMIDSVQSTKYLTQKEADLLTSKLKGLTDKYTAASLSQRKAFVANRIKRLDDSSLKNIGLIYEAISSDSQISLKYFHYSNEKRGLDKKYVNNGKRFNLSPFAFYVDKGNYYLYAYDTRWKTSKMRFFRVDRIDSLEIMSDIRREGTSDFKETSLTKMNSKMFNMYQGKSEKVRFKVANHLADVIVDEFGKVLMVPYDKDHFIFIADVQISPTFFAWLFTFGPEITILEPDPVKRMMRDKAEEIENAYK